MRTLVGRSLLLVGAAAAGALVVQCGSSQTQPPDGGSDATPDVGGDAGCGFCTDASPPDSSTTSGYFLVVTETPAGSPPVASWGGVLRYTISADYAAATQGVAIPADGGVHDPVGLVFRYASQELLVGNRHGNDTGDGVAGSVSRFKYDAQAETFTYESDILDSSLHCNHQPALDPTESELYVANYCDPGGISEFALAADGTPTYDGLLASGSGFLGVAVAPDGQRLYATERSPDPSNVIRQFSLPSGTDLGSFSVPGSSRLHFMSIYGQDLYVGDVDTVVYRLKIDANDDLSVTDTVAATTPISVALSPSGKELFADGHSFNATSIIDRFMPDGGGWSAETTNISTPSSLGGVHVFPVNGVKVN
jgi:hypothetical protein